MTDKKNLKLEINDLSLLKITKVKYGVVYFEYAGDKYILHESTDDYENTLTLYKKVYLDKIGGKFKMVYVSSILSDLSGYIEYKNYKNGKTYSQIDKKNFVIKLIKHGLCSGELEKEVEVVKNNNKKLIEKIDLLEEIIRNLKSEIVY